MRKAAFLLICAALSAQAALAGDPSWFPAKHCRDAWGPARILKGEHLYNYKKNGKYSDFAKPLSRSDCYKDWAVLVYMAADNDLAPYAYWDLYEMESGYSSQKHFGASTLKTDLIVQLDTPGSTGIRRLHMYQVPEVYDPLLGKKDFDQRKESDIRSPVIDTLPEGVPAGQSLQEFLDWGMRAYPARHYMVIVWGHGQGWTAGPAAALPATTRYLESEDTDFKILPIVQPGSQGPFLGRRFGGIAFNQTNETYLDIPTLRESLRKARVDTLEDQRPIDVYASDACLMQMLEVATELSEESRFVIGSTQVQNFLGLPYRRLMYELNTGHFSGLKPKLGTEDEPFLMAHMVPEVFRQSFQPGGLQNAIAPEAVKSVTMSSLSSAALRQSLIPNIRDLATALDAYLTEDQLDIRREELRFVLQKAPGFQGGAKDIGVFLGLLKILVDRESAKSGLITPAAKTLKDTVTDTQKALQMTVLNSTFGTDYASAQSKLYLLGFKAVSLWLPASEQDYKNRIQDFSASSFYKDTQWGTWIKNALR